MNCGDPNVVCTSVDTMWFVLAVAALLGAVVWTWLQSVVEGFFNHV